MPGPEPPLATALHCQYVGRALFIVEGHPGLWCGQADRFGDAQPESLEVTVGPPQRGRARRRTLYRLDALTKQFKEALG